jgi:hypothetical protein
MHVQPNDRYPWDTDSVRWAAAHDAVGMAELLEVEPLSGVLSSTTWMAIGDPRRQRADFGARAAYGG